MAHNRGGAQFEILEGPSVLSPRELRALLQAPDQRTRRGKRDAALLAVLCLGGLRAGECASLVLRNVENGPNGIVRLRFRTLKRRNHWRLVSLPAIGGRAVRAWLGIRVSDTPWLFPGALGKALCVRAIEKRVAIHMSSIDRSDLHLHSTRHSALSTVMRQTGDLYRVQRMAGHANPNTTAQAYLSWSTREADENAAAMASALSPRNRPFHYSEYITQKNNDVTAFKKQSIHV
jgi:integrase/recombinase XerD